MNTIINIITRGIIFSLTSLILISCGSAKYSAEFKSKKIYVDTICIVNPVVEILAVNKAVSNLDTLLTIANIDLISKTTRELLDSKYVLKKTHFPIHDFSLLDEVLDKLEKSPILINNVSIEKILQKVQLNANSRFVLLVTYKGKINPNLETNYNMKAGLKTNSLYFNPSTKPFSDMRFVIIDTLKKEVVCYERLNSSNYDPRIPSQIEQMTKTILKSIYYK